MANATVSFVSTLTNGIQDVSAFAAVFATDLVEKQMGRSDSSGFLYASACGMSMFGSLGTAKWGLMSLLPNKWMKTAMLADDTNFLWKYSVAHYLFSKGDRQYGNAYIDAIFGLSYMRHYQGFRTVKVELKLDDEGTWYFFYAVVSCLMFSAMGMLPFVHIIRNDQTYLWGPVLRCTGTLLLSLQAITIPYYLAWLAKPRNVYDFESTGWRLPDPTMTQRLLSIFWLILIFIGSAMVLVGYIGSFTAVQNASDGNSGIIWFCVELLMMMLRLLIWTQSVHWDDQPGLIAYVTADQPRTKTDYISDNKRLSFDEAAVYVAAMGVVLKWPKDKYEYNFEFQSDKVTLYVFNNDDYEEETFTITDATNENISGEANSGIVVRSERLGHECLLPDRRGPTSSTDFSLFCDDLEIIYTYDFKLLECLLQFRQAVNGILPSPRSSYLIISRNKDDDDDAPDIKMLYEKMPPPIPYT
ncbi:hypothetical protein K450DRAFT_288725 [Umbelopsis ramanniana AG]|uniref:Uncharacterized protein n=1 Tax=Umbelopsis ramanniana AG TaxID=1314678 RepID=A0AAD5HDV7_UMBRA|nr:uncharacterized protein K450DRAFT_288725 [Umbelopsis ramanniana AG]KAI8578926.1 hypothetical protein K450DRAFT_288725 [Umbelopsis ramanniana AG]